MLQSWPVQDVAPNPTVPAMKRLSLLLLALVPLGPAQAQPPANPDLLLTNGNVLTMDPQRPRAEAVAVRDGRIAWVGSGAEATRLFPKPSRAIDLQGATVLPGIIDAHGHLLSLGESSHRPKQPARYR